MDNATPRPWSLLRARNKKYGWYIQSKGDVTLGEIETSGIFTKPEQCEANPRLIVHCVNTHDELVSALEDLYNICVNKGFDIPKMELFKAKQALAKASE